MATLNIGGRRVTVDDGFMSLSPEDQQKTVDEMEASLPPAEAAPAAAPAPMDAAPPLDPLAPGPQMPTLVGPAPPLERPAPPRAMGSRPALPAGRASRDETVIEVPLDEVRAGKLTAQGLGGAAANVVGAIPDIPALIQGGLYAGADKLVGMAGLPTRADTGLETGLGLPSDMLKSGASWLGNYFGYEKAVPETTREKALSNVVELGGTGLGSAAILSKLAGMREAALKLPGATPLRTDNLVRPYFDQPARTAVGDTIAGGTSGAGLTGSQEYTPKSVREAGGGLGGAAVDLLAMLGSGVSAGTLYSGIAGTPGSTLNALRRRADSNLSVDPASGVGSSNQAADEAARLMQSITSNDPKVTAQNIGQQVSLLRQQGLPVPTTDIVLGGEAADLGLTSLGKRARTQAGPGNTLLDPNLSPENRQRYSFGERDAAQKQAAADEVQATRPTDVAREVVEPPAPAYPGSLPRQQPIDTETFARRAQERADAELAARQRLVDQPTGGAREVQIAREEAARPIENTTQADAVAANQAIHRDVTNTRVAERNQSQELYANPDLTQQLIPVDPLLTEAAAIRSQATGTTPVRRSTVEYLDRAEAAAETGVLPGSALIQLKKDIEAEIKLSLRDGQDFQQLKALKNSIDRTFAQLPEGHPARVALEAAETNYAERVQPNYRRFAGGDLNRDLETRPGQVYPSETGDKFLLKPESVDQLIRIGEQRGTTGRISANARTIIFDQLAKAGVVKDGIIDAAAMTRWRNRNNAIFPRIPGLGDEIERIVTSAQRGSARAGEYAADIAAAEARLGQARKTIEGGPVGQLAKQTPAEVVASIMDGRDAARKITELRKQTGNSPEAAKSLKAAVADYFAERVSSFDHLVDTPEHAVNLRKLIKEFNGKRDALSAAGFTPEDLNSLQRAQTVLEPLTRRNVQATVGSTTAESTEQAMRPLELALKGYYGILKGGGVFRTVKVALKTIAGDQTLPVGRLISRAMFDPELAQALLTRDIKSVGTPAWNSALQKTIRRMTVAKDLATEDQE